MHHNKSGRQLSRNTSHRKAMFRNMVDSLMEFERIETTLPKAKELRRYADRVITLGKKGTLHDKRRALTLMRRRSMVGKVFDQLAERFRDRNGGYTRIFKLGPRAGDLTPMALVELVGSFGESSKEAAPKKSSKSKKPKSKPGAKKDSEPKTTQMKKTSKKKEKK